MGDVAQLTFWQQALAKELVRLREVADLTQDQVRRELGWSLGKISKIENANSAISDADLERLLDLYGMTGRGRDTLAGMNQPRTGGWFDLHSEYLPSDYMEYIRLEDQAETAFVFDVAATLHGLLQTEEYARAVVTANTMGMVSPAAIDRRVDVRMRRQDVLTRDQPLKVDAVLAESVLRWEVGGQDAMRRQRQHLLRLS
jgi:transcriptional regulator with XRE-family HTH domain